MRVLRGGAPLLPPADAGCRTVARLTSLGGQPFQFASEIKSVKEDLRDGWGYWGLECLVYTSVLLLYFASLSLCESGLRQEHSLRPKGGPVWVCGARYVDGCS